jgi:hypothetical protein
MTTLNEMSIEQVRETAMKLGIKPHHKAKKETIINQINQQPNAYKAQVMGENYDKMAPAHVNTEEDVRQACQKFFEKEGFNALFPKDGTWIFQYKGSEESGNMAIPLVIIRNKAENVSRGKRGMKLISKGDGEYKGYADQILA